MKWKWLLLVAVGLLAEPGASRAQEYEILAVRYGSLDDFPLRSLLPDAAAGETLDAAMALGGQSRVR